MAKSIYQKCKLLFLMKIFMELTDEDHGLTLSEITEELERYQIIAERKTLYDDFEMLRHFGLDIVGEKCDRKYYYKLCSRDFEIAELKLLVDSVQSAKFITEKKSNELIKKLESLTSKHEARMLHRQVYVTGRVKADNEKILYNVDIIHDAISANKRIRFQYFSWNEKKEMELRHNGECYDISPWGLSWDDENYYLIGYDKKDEIIKHFRVDKMLNISLLEYAREGKEKLGDFNIADYSKKIFSMFDGEEQNVKIRFKNSVAGIAIDRFGKETPFVPDGDGEHFTVTVKVLVSRQFLAWIISLGDAAQIVGPENVVDEMKEEIEKIYNRYK